MELVDLWGWFCLLPTFAMFSLPLVAIRDAWRHPEFIHAPNLIDPMLGMWANCMVWVAYAIIVSNALIAICNVVGLVVSVVGVTVFYLKTGPVHIRRQRLATGGVFALIFFISVLVHWILTGVTAMHVSGSIAVCGSFVLFLSTLSVTRKVWEIKDPSLISIPATAGMFVCAVCWVIYGMFKPDHFIWVANGVGVLVTLFSFVTWAKHRSFAPATPAVTTKDVDVAAHHQEQPKKEEDRPAAVEVDQKKATATPQLLAGAGKETPSPSVSWNCTPTATPTTKDESHEMPPMVYNSREALQQDSGRSSRKAVDTPHAYQI